MVVPCIAIAACSFNLPTHGFRSRQLVSRRGTATVVFLRHALYFWQLLIGGLFMAEARSSMNLRNQASLSSPDCPQTLSGEVVLDALKMILIGTSLTEVLTSVTRLIEAHSDGMLCSIFVLDKDGQHLRYAAAPNLPESYRAATDGLAIGPNAGSCGAAAYLRQPVFAADILSDPNWVRFRNSAMQAGLRAAWSSPILSHAGRVLGTFGMYYREVRSPSPTEIQLIDDA